MNPVSTVYPQKLLCKPSSIPTQKTTGSRPRKRSLSDELPYIYVIPHSKRTGYFSKNFQCHLCHC